MAIPQINKALTKTVKTIKLRMYNILVIFFSTPLTIFWAVVFGCSAFLCTWVWSLFLRLLLMGILIIMPLYTEVNRSLSYPVADAMGCVFRQIQIKTLLDDNRLHIQSWNVPLYKIFECLVVHSFTNYIMHYVIACI